MYTGMSSPEIPLISPANFALKPTQLDPIDIIDPSIVPVIGLPVDPLEVQQTMDSQSVEALFHVGSDVVPAPAGYWGNCDPRYDEAASYERFCTNYPEVAEQAARMVGGFALGALTEHADTYRSMFEIYKVIVPL